MKKKIYTDLKELESYVNEQFPLRTIDLIANGFTDKEIIEELWLKPEYRGALPLLRRILSEMSEKELADYLKPLIKVN